jgi:uncharacterized alkaline shock family protein YloU
VCCGSGDFQQDLEFEIVDRRENVMSTDDSQLKTSQTRSRILPSEEGMARSVQLQCINQSQVPIDLMVFVVYEKSITVNMSTGQEIA